MYYQKLILQKIHYISNINSNKIFINVYYMMFNINMFSYIVILRGQKESFEIKKIARFTRLICFDYVMRISRLLMRKNP